MSTSSSNRSRIVDLTAEECLQLLGTKVVGRIAVVTPAGLRIFPVNYALWGDRIVFRTLPYGVIANNAHGAEVAFEIDDHDEELTRGWSVLAAGPCTRVEDPDDVRQIRSEADPIPWAEGQRILYFRIDWTDLTGRTVGMDGMPADLPTMRSGS